ncbi:MAG TPA: exo-alpha-sialidase [Caldilineae bacterium]|nr:exo-alpha-sialidase [Caldilineae bacterium]
MCSLALVVLSGVRGPDVAAATKWEFHPLNFPYGAVIDLAQHPQQPQQLWAIVEALTAQRVVTALYRSDDGGQTWSPAGNDLSWLTFTTIAVSPSGTLFLGTSDGLYRRDPLDVVWRRVPLEHATGSELFRWPDRGMTIRQVILPGTNPDKIYVVAAENQKYPRHWLFRSQDGGQSFKRLLIREFDTGPGSGLGRVLVDPQDADRLYAATQGGVLISQDGGVTWLPGGLDPSLTQGMTVLAASPGTPTVLFAARLIQDDRGLHLAIARSQDQGRTWSEFLLSSGSPAHPTALLALLDGRLVLSTSEGVLIGSWEDPSWTLMEGDLGAMGAYRLFLDQGREDVLWAATPLGVYRWEVNEPTWRPSSQGLPPNGMIHALYSSKSAPDIWLAAMPWSGTEIPPPPSLLIDSDLRWHAARGLGRSRINAFAKDPLISGRVYAATYEGVCWSSDYGHTWQGCGLTDHVVRQVLVSSEGILYAATYKAGLYRSDDAGETWRQVAFDGAQVGPMLIRSDGLYVVVQEGEPGIYRSQDGGLTWQALGGPVEPGVGIVQLAGNDQLLIAAVVGGGLWLSRDAGKTWEQTRGLPSDATFDVVWVDPRRSGRIIVARQDAGLWASEDGGRTWESIGRTLGDNRVTAIAADYRSADGIILATERAGLWASGPPKEELSLPSVVDARIEIVWPHGWAPVDQATRANLSLRLFRPDSLEPVPCGWDPPVEVWEARDSELAQRLARAQPRRLGDATMSLWDVNDIDVSYAQERDAKLYYLVRIPGVMTRTSVWAHAADARTYYPLPAWPQAVSSRMPEGELDARILVVWPHDIDGRPRPVEEADWANVRVGLYLPGTLTSVPPDPELVVRLMGALDNDIGRTIGIGYMRIISGDVSYPVWDFDNIDVSAARDGRSRWTFWIEVDGYKTRSNVWVHGVDARTYFPVMDQPIVGCRP